MRMKSYFAGTVEAAMGLARQELGPDAMLVHSRRATPETRELGEYEVVFALAAMADGEPPASEPVPVVPAIKPEQRDEMMKQLTTDIGDLKKRIERMSGLIAETRMNAVTPAEASYARFFATLLGSGIETELAREIAGKVPASEAERDERWPSILEGAIHVDPTLGTPGATRKIVALVGPPGAGKTTTLVKLAANYGLAGRRRAALFTTDIYRIAAADQLRAYAALLGVGFECLETPHALDQALEEHRNKELILIDTPGLSEADMAECREMADHLAAAEDIDVHLVVPASMRSTDLARTARRYSVFSPTKVIFTKTDETEQFGPMVNVSREFGMPISFLSSGQRVPEDLEEANKARLVEFILGQRAVEGARSTAA